MLTGTPAVWHACKAALGSRGAAGVISQPAPLHPFWVRARKPGVASPHAPSVTLVCTTVKAFEQHLPVFLEGDPPSAHPPFLCHHPIFLLASCTAAHSTALLLSFWYLVSPRLHACIAGSAWLAPLPRTLPCIASLPVFALPTPGQQCGQQHRASLRGRACSSRRQCCCLPAEPS